MFRLLTALLFISASSFGQCDYETEIDPITEQKTVRYRSQLIGPFGKMLRFQFSITKANTFMFIDVGSPSIFGLEKGSKVYFKSDKGLITLEQSTSSTASYTVNQIGSTSITTWSASMMASVTKGEMAQLIENAPSFMRIETTKGNFDYELKPKHAEKLIEVFNCIYRILPEKTE